MRSRLNVLRMKKYLRSLGLVLAIPIVLTVLLFLLFYFPPFQNWAVKQVAEYASEESGMEITIDKVKLVFPLDLGVEGVKVIKPSTDNGNKADTVACIKKIVVDVQLLPLFRGQVEIDELALSGMKVNTTDFVPQAVVKGDIGQLNLKAHGIDLSAETVNIDDAVVSTANISVAMNDSVPEDTTTSENFWKINVGKLSLENTKVAISMPGDSMRIAAGFDNASVTGGFFDLHDAIYKINVFEWNGMIAYDIPSAQSVKGFDVNHIKLNDVALAIKDLSFRAPDLTMNIAACAFKEKCGLSVSNITGKVSMDSLQLKLPEIKAVTQNSELTAKLIMDLNAFDDKAPGQLHLYAKGALGKKDLMVFMEDMPAEFKRQWPYSQLTVSAIAHGNMQRMALDELKIELPSAIKASAKGQMANLNDMGRLLANVDFEAHSQNLKFVTTLLDKNVAAMMSIPSGIAIKGNASIDGQKYSAKFKATEGKGSVSGNASINLADNSYTTKLIANNLQLQHFTRGLGLSPLTASIDIDGKGFDIMSPRTKLLANIDLKKFSYKDYNLDGIRGQAEIKNGNIAADITSSNKAINGNITFDALTNGKKISATLACQLHELDLFKMKIVESPLKVSTCTHLDISSDLKANHKLQGTIGDIWLQDKDGEYRPEDIDMDIIAMEDTTHAIVNCGDFNLDMDASGSYEKVMTQIMDVAEETMKQMKDRYIDQTRLRERLPEARIKLKAGKENIFARLLKRYGLEYGSLNVDLTSSPTGGMDGFFAANTMYVNKILIDETRFNINSDENGVTYQLQVKNNKDNPDYVFNAIIDGTLTERGTTLTPKLYDWKNRLGLSASLSANMEDNGLRISFTGNDAILGYKNFNINKGNYILLSDSTRVSADLKLKAADGTGFQVYTNDENLDALQDITLSVNRLDMDDIFAILPFTPNMTGILYGDFHAIQTKDELSLSSSLNIDDLIYEGCKMGNVGTEFTYMPRPDGSHYIDGILLHDQEEVGTLTGTYVSEGDGYIDARLEMTKTPLYLANGFIPDQLLGLKGYGNGELTIKGSMNAPQVDGEIALDSAYLYSMPYGVELKFGNKPVTIAESKLRLDNFAMYSYNEKPLTASGYVDFSKLDNMYASIILRAENFLLINAKENSRSEAYGKAYVNFYGRLQGALDNLQMRGKLDVLGATDMTYILKDSPITTDNQLDELVKFTNFADSASMETTRPPLSGFDMDLTVSINESAHILCALNANKTNYIDLIGGGDLRMRYNNIDNLSLRGRYTLSNGEMKYSLPVIPLKTFVIQDGSYVEFSGDPMNPKLNITALESTKASVSDDNGVSRSVDFQCGVIITRTLNDMGLEFVIYAPQDMTISNELNTMSKEERGKIAVTMLTTGMYLVDGNTGKFSMNSALSAFLQSQINGIAGNALRTLDLSFGLDNTTDASGNVHTDYSFKFSKRFWNNRLRIIVGGKLSTGSDVANQNESFFNNVQFEYRLNDASTQYLKLFYNRDSYDWLEGNIGEYGGGFIWRRKLQRFKDIFRFKENRTTIPMPADSTKKVNNNE